jgi:hypothetical protein
MLLQEAGKGNKEIEPTQRWAQSNQLQPNPYCTTPWVTALLGRMTPNLVASKKPCMNSGTLRDGLAMASTVKRSASLISTNGATADIRRCASSTEAASAVNLSAWVKGS